MNICFVRLLPVQLAQQIMPHLSDVRSSKTSFQLTTVLALVKQIASSTVAKDKSPRLSSWEAVGESITQLIEEGGKLLPLTLETENVLKGSFAFRLSSRCLSLLQYLAWHPGL
jgi:dynactin 1